jgi:hypothetical protein
MTISDSLAANKITLALDGTDQLLYFRKRSSTGNDLIYNTATSVKIADGWTKIVVTDDGLNTASSVKIYIDGTTDLFTSRSTAGTYADLDPIGTDETISIPYNNHATVFGEGRANLYRQYNEVLTTSEITELGTTTPSGLTTSLQGKCVLEKRFNNDHTSAIGTDGSAVGTPTFDTDIPV